MANYATLKAAINAVIRANGNKEITGTVLNETLTAMVNSLGADYQFAGVATPSTNPGTPDQNMFWLAGGGIYENFGSQVRVPFGYIGVFSYNGTFTKTILPTSGILDISVLSANSETGVPTEYASLSNALVAVPSAFQRGGMEVQYIDSTTHKYVKYRLVAANWSTTVSNWQSLNVDNKPIDASDNLVKSGGVAPLSALAQNQAQHIVKDSSIKSYDASQFQNGYINPQNGKNATLAYNHIRSESILIAKEDFHLIISNNIKGRIYFFSAFNLNTFANSFELGNNYAYFIPNGTYYRLALCYSDDSTPDISDILSNVQQLKLIDHDIAKLVTITSKKFDSSIFQRGSISTVNGTNGNDQRMVRTTGLETAKENFYISLPDNIHGNIFYFSKFSYASYTGYAELQTNGLTYVPKGTYYRLALWYTNYENLPNPDVSELINSIGITKNIIDNLERIDFNAENSRWGVGEISLSTGASVTNSNRIRCTQIKKCELSITATGGYAFSIYVYNGSSYMGCLNENNVLSTDTVKWWKKFDLTDLSNKHPEYIFSIVACRMDSTNTLVENVMTAAEGDNIKLLTPYEMKLFEKEIFCPLVSFIDDDLPSEAVDNWYSICNEVGVRIGFAVPTGEITTEMWEVVRRLQSDGFDFCSHTHNHINLMNETDPDVIKADLQASVDTFNDNGVKVNSLVYPQSSISNLALGIVKQFFEFSFNGVDGINSIQGNPLRQHNITRSNTVEPGMSDWTDPATGITYRVHAMLPLATLKYYVDKAVEENCWVIFETHFRNSMTTDESNDGFNFTPQMRQETIDLIKYAVGKGCKVVTPAEGYHILKNRLMHGVYGSNYYHIVDHNGFVYRKNM